MGVFSNRPEKYLPRLQESINKYYPDIPLIVTKHKGSILAGYTNMLEAFRKSGKRYFLFMDDDIVILNGNIIKNAFELLISQKYAAVIAHMTYNKLALTNLYDNSKLTSHLEKVLMGYFALCDSTKIKDIYFDQNLPWKNVSTETDFGLSIQSMGFELGICADYLYHENKPDTNPHEHYLETNKYLENKWGVFFRDNVQFDGYLVNLPEGVNN
jgi:glycosyltransferase involved in cell wall biosynthesis